MKRFVEYFLNFIFPPKCCVCGNILEFHDSRNICGKCFNEIKLIKPPVCRYCGKKVFGDRDNECCAECGSQERYFDEALCACEYAGAVKRILTALKFEGKIKLCAVIADILFRRINKVTENPKFDIIICVPLHFERLKERGYNQSELIARQLGEMLGIAYIPGLIERTKNTLSQSRLSRKDRIENVKGAFRIAENTDIKNKNILLVDDILTTGSTLKECSRILKEAGAGYVAVAAVATGSNRIGEE